MSMDQREHVEEYSSSVEAARQEAIRANCAWNVARQGVRGDGEICSSLSSIMREQELERQHVVKVSDHLKNIEEELLRLALERSLADTSEASVLDSRPGTSPSPHDCMVLSARDSLPSNAEHSDLLNYDDSPYRVARELSGRSSEQFQNSCVHADVDKAESDVIDYLPNEAKHAGLSHRGSHHDLLDDLYDFTGAEQILTPEELDGIRQALGEADSTREHCVEADLSPEDAAAIQAVLMENKHEEERKRVSEQQSVLLALEIEQEEQLANRTSRKQKQGNVRVMTRDDLEAEQSIGVNNLSSTVPHYPQEEEEEEIKANAGFRMNSTDRQDWTRLGDLVVGPENELLTKHDIALNAMANAHRLGLVDKNNIGNKAFNAFRASIKKTKHKGVASHSTGRAGSDDTRNGVLDPQVRLLISKAINSGMIDRCFGIVKEGKEAVVCYAEKDVDATGVAVKVFKRMTEFRGRADYVQGDIRYVRENFKKLGAREQLSLWAEKEYRNLTRAQRAGVPVPMPIAQIDNVLFMTFLGTNGWPAPQLRELKLRHGSKRWHTLYLQVLSAIRKLYQIAKLVHADLSEYNILVAPAFLVENKDEAIEDPLNELQATLIDFGQAIDRNHPNAARLLARDLARLNYFFTTQGVDVMEEEASYQFVADETEESNRATVDRGVGPAIDELH